MKRASPIALAFAAALAAAASCAGSDPVGGTGTAGADGPGGSGSGTGSGGSGGTSGSEAPTFTWLYDNMFRGYCSDRNQPCHNPSANRVMPPINPQVPADLQARLAAWIDAGAIDN